jgi:hypothetical protein
VYSAWTPYSLAELHNVEMPFLCILPNIEHRRPVVSTREICRRRPLLGPATAMAPSHRRHPVASVPGKTAPQPVPFL